MQRKKGMDFKDYFSKQSHLYQRNRPSYPRELFSFLSNQTKTHELAWDCATGNGQAALGLAEFYNKVYATDPSEQQLLNAIQNPRITYKNETAENASLKDSSVDLITVAQAMHWFDFPKFFAEVKRVLKSDGIVAVWTYGPPIISPDIDKLVLYFRDTVVGKYWQRENQYVTDKYATIPFPFKEIVSPEFSFQKEIDQEDLIGLLTSWSATQRYKDYHGKDPVKKIEKKFNQLWRLPDSKKIAIWYIYFKVGIQ